MHDLSRSHHRWHRERLAAQAREAEVAGSTRLAYQTKVSGDVTIERLVRNCADVSRAQVAESSIPSSEERTLRHEVPRVRGAVRPRLSCSIAGAQGPGRAQGPQWHVPTRRTDRLQHTGPRTPGAIDIGVLMEHQRRFTKELYRRLFELVPDARALFRGDLENQGQMLSHMLQFLVFAMSRPETMLLGLRELGRRHVAYGVATEHYPSFRQAFLESARTILGEKHTPQVEKAWAETIDMVIESMLGPVAEGSPAGASMTPRRTIPR